MSSDRPITERQRISVPAPMWVALIAAVMTASGAWYATRADAAQAKATSEDNAAEIRGHDRRIQKLEDVIMPALSNMQKSLEHMEKSQERGR